MLCDSSLTITASRSSRGVEGLGTAEAGTIFGSKGIHFSDIVSTESCFGHVGCLHKSMAHTALDDSTLLSLTLFREIRSMYTPWF